MTKELESGTIAYVGCIAIGAGIGLWLNQLVPGVLIGFGAGFVLMALMSKKR